MSTRRGSKHNRYLQQWFKSELHSATEGEAKQQKYQVLLVGTLMWRGAVKTSSGPDHRLYESTVSGAVVQSETRSSNQSEVFTNMCWIIRLRFSAFL